MKLIRLNCFETNSSSTHCLIITDENTFEKWTDNKLFYKPCGHDFVTKENFEWAVETATEKKKIDCSLAEF